jgi:hypothetical protein
MISNLSAPHCISIAHFVLVRRNIYTALHFLASGCIHALESVVPCTCCAEPSKRQCLHCALRAHRRGTHRQAMKRLVLCSRHLQEPANVLLRCDSYDGPGTLLHSGRREELTGLVVLSSHSLWLNINRISDERAESASLSKLKLVICSWTPSRRSFLFCLSSQIPLPVILLLLLLCYAVHIL